MAQWRHKPVWMDQGFLGWHLITVACVFSKSPTYTREHVLRLERMVSENMKQPHRFVCLDDSPFSGWWAKISLFQPGRFKGRVLYLDLDVTITGSLDELADYPGSFVICRDWGRFGYNSSVMAWDAGTADHLYTDFIQSSDSIMSKLRGDQDWITAKKPEASTFPRGWCFSYRLGKRIGFPKDVRVIVYHGRPKPWSLPDNDLEVLRV